ncbi:MAG: protein-glutamate methylesterase/protein-glutamine glutaminase [Alphaproteobacteria bacterium]
MIITQSANQQSFGKEADPIRVMVVDDSAIVRGMITKMLETDPDFKVVATVSDGQMALSTLSRETIDVVILDLQMPRMDGMTALPKILALSPGIKILIASTVSHKNAEISLQALRAGAADYLAKPSSNSELSSAEYFKRELLEKARSLGQSKGRAKNSKALSAQFQAINTAKTEETNRANHMASTPAPVMNKGQPLSIRPIPPHFYPDAIAIGSSTGGPQALFEVISTLATAQLNQPIFITQHMPPTFTTILAEQIERQCKIPCFEGKDGMLVSGGKVYLAPGDYHMIVQPARDGHGMVIGLNKEAPENFCRPAVDPLLRSIAQSYRRGILTVILTGMGHDGLRGAQKIVEQGGVVIAQDEESSVVWGMPGAVATAGLCSAVLPLKEIAGQIIRLASKRFGH